MPVIGEIRPFAFSFAPVGWMPCNGQTLSIAEHEVLFSILGTTFGGDGVTTFALPDLQGRVPRHTSGSPPNTPVYLGERGGYDDYTLSADELPAHEHALVASDGAAVDGSPTGLLPARGLEQAYAPSGSRVEMARQVGAGGGGGGQPHSNRQPYTVLNWCIAVEGLFPTTSGSLIDDYPYLGQIGMFAGDFVPYGWMPCDGRLLPITGYTALFALLGTSYGGNGQTTFALPDLRGRVPLHRGPGDPLGSMGGAEQVTLTQAQIPPHLHQPLASAATGTSRSPAGNLPARSSGALYADAGSAGPATTIQTAAVGNGQPHDNMAPSLAVQFMIAVAGVFPVRD